MPHGYAQYKWHLRADLMRAVIFFMKCIYRITLFEALEPKPTRPGEASHLSQAVSEVLSCVYGYTQNTNHFIAQKYQMQREQFSID